MSVNPRMALRGAGHKGTPHAIYLGLAGEIAEHSDGADPFAGGEADRGNARRQRLVAPLKADAGVTRLTHPQKARDQLAVGGIHAVVQQRIDVTADDLVSRPSDEIGDGGVNDDRPSAVVEDDDSVGNTLEHSPILAEGLGHLPGPLLHTLIQLPIDGPQIPQRTAQAASREPGHEGNGKEGEHGERVGQRLESQRDDGDHHTDHGGRNETGVWTE
jgi:hypothetical protein